MSEPENILQRWSRRKREAAEESALVADDRKVQPPPRTESAASDSPGHDATSKDATSKNELPFDVSTLPSLESIGANSDVRAFMQPGVPLQLRHAALRRAWSMDTEIRDFIGPVENGWNFNDPDSIPGFGSLAQGEDIARLLAQAIGEPQPDTASPPEGAEFPRLKDGHDQNQSPVAESDTTALAEDVAQTGGGQNSEIAEEVSGDASDDVAAQQRVAQGRRDPSLQRRGHGGALPE